MSITWVSQGHDMGKQMDLELKGCCNVLNEFGLFGCMLQVSQVPDPTYRCIHSSWTIHPPDTLLAA